MLIKGIPVVLYERTQTGTDAFNAPVFEETPTIVENVLVAPTATNEIVSELQLYGKQSEYTLCIPKGDTHDWENRRIEFFGKVWQSFGFVEEYIDDLVPLSWNKKVKVSRYG